MKPDRGYQNVWAMEGGGPHRAFTRNETKLNTKSPLQRATPCGLTQGAGGYQISTAFWGSLPRGSHAQIFFLGGKPLIKFPGIKQFKRPRLRGWNDSRVF